MDQTGGTDTLTILVPSRGRPDAILDYLGVFYSSTTAQTSAVVIIDEDDPTLQRYVAQLGKHGFSYLLAPRSARGMVSAVNFAFKQLSVQGKLGNFVGFQGDDHRPRTPGWDSTYIHELNKLQTGIVYGDDGFQHEEMPTQVAMTTDIPKVLGYFCPPSLDHLCVDVIWKNWGKAIDRIVYLPQVYIEHMHPLAGKARMDKNYRAVNSVLVQRHDSQAYADYMANIFPQDIGKLKMYLEHGWNDDLFS